MNSPLVSLGVPIFNCEDYIGKTLDSILSQSYENLEIVVSDNQSTDKTAEICRAYAAKDKRVRFHQNAENIGAIGNFNRLFELATGAYFMWVGSHDLLAPNFVSVCLNRLESDPEMILCGGRLIQVDESGRRLSEVKNALDTRSLPPAERFRRVAHYRTGYESYGLIRVKKMMPAPVLKNIFFSDFTFLADLSLRGTFSFTDETSMSVRVFGARDQMDGEHPHLKVARLLPRRLARGFTGWRMTRFPFAECTLSLWSILYHSKLSWREKWSLAFAGPSSWKWNVLREFSTRFIPKTARGVLKKLITRVSF